MNRKNSKEDLQAEVLILGGGIVGITSGIVMQKLGFRTAIISESIAVQNTARQADPAIATNYAMASAYPHNLRIENLLKISDDSQLILRHLFETENSGIQKHRIFEVFEHEPDASSSPLSDRRMKFEQFHGKPSELKSSIDPPARPGANYLWGWVFDSYFADMPIYLSSLWTQFRQDGGSVHFAKIESLSDLSSLELLPSDPNEESHDTAIRKIDGKIIINCLGLGAISVCKDKTAARIVRGKQLIAPDAIPIFDKTGLQVAYNYTPTPEVFHRADGSAEYVHFFSRADGWILGQTREAGNIDSQGKWFGDVAAEQEIVIDNLAVPKPILTLNNEILKSWKGVSIREDKLIAREGYRYYRDPEQSGVRLEAEELANNYLIHNYGHGGSGITMSWGSAVACAQMILNKTRMKQTSNDAFGKLILNCVAETAT